MLVLASGRQLQTVSACGGKGQAGGALEEEGLGVEGQEGRERGGGERGQRVGETRGLAVVAKEGSGEATQTRAEDKRFSLEVFEECN